jgi:hypothetical protein
MPLFEIPSSDGYHSDVVFIRDPNNMDKSIVSMRDLFARLNNHE